MDIFADDGDKETRTITAEQAMRFSREKTAEAVIHMDAQMLEITSIATLANFSNMEFLFLKGNALSSLTGIEGMPRLKIIDASSNRLSQLPPASTWAKLKQLRFLELHQNHLKDISALKPLSASPGLASLTCYWNTVAVEPDYRFSVIRLIPPLMSLDDQLIAEEEAVADVKTLGMMRLGAEKYQGFGEGMKITPAPIVTRRMTKLQHRQMFWERLWTMYDMRRSKRPVVILQRVYRGHRGRFYAGLKRDVLISATNRIKRNWIAHKSRIAVREIVQLVWEQARLSSAKEMGITMSSWEEKAKRIEAEQEKDRRRHRKHHRKHSSHKTATSKHHRSGDGDSSDDDNFGGTDDEKEGDGGGGGNNDNNNNNNNNFDDSAAARRISSASMGSVNSNFNPDALGSAAIMASRGGESRASSRQQRRLTGDTTVSLGMEEESLQTPKTPPPILATPDGTKARSMMVTPDGRGGGGGRKKEWGEGFARLSASMVVGPVPPVPPTPTNIAAFAAFLQMDGMEINTNNNNNSNVAAATDGNPENNNEVSETPTPTPTPGATSSSSSQVPRITWHHYLPRNLAFSPMENLWGFGQSDDDDFSNGKRRRNVNFGDGGRMNRSPVVYIHPRDFVVASLLAELAVKFTTSGKEKSPVTPGDDVDNPTSPSAAADAASVHFYWSTVRIVRASNTPRVHYGNVLFPGAVIRLDHPMRALDEVISERIAFIRGHGRVLGILRAVVLKRRDCHVNTRMIESFHDYYEAAVKPPLTGTPGVDAVKSLALARRRRADGSKRPRPFVPDERAHQRFIRVEFPTDAARRRFLELVNRVNGMLESRFESELSKESPDAMTLLKFPPRLWTASEQVICRATARHAIQASLKSHLTRVMKIPNLTDRLLARRAARAIQGWWKWKVMRGRIAALARLRRFFESQPSPCIYADPDIMDQLREEVFKQNSVFPEAKIQVGFNVDGSIAWKVHHLPNTPVITHRRLPFWVLFGMQRDMGRFFSRLARLGSRKAWRERRKLIQENGWFRRVAGSSSGGAGGDGAANEEVNRDASKTPSSIAEPMNAGGSSNGRRTRMSIEASTSTSNAASPLPPASPDYTALRMSPAPPVSPSPDDPQEQQQQQQQQQPVLEANTAGMEADKGEDEEDIGGGVGGDEGDDEDMVNGIPKIGNDGIEPESMITLSVAPVGGIRGVPLGNIVSVGVVRVQTVERVPAQPGFGRSPVGRRTVLKLTYSSPHEAWQRAAVLMLSTWRVAVQDCVPLMSAEMLMRREAAVVLQSVWRGNVVRRWFKPRRRLLTKHLGTTIYEQRLAFWNRMESPNYFVLPPNVEVVGREYTPVIYTSGGASPAATATLMGTSSSAGGRPPLPPPPPPPPTAVSEPRPRTVGLKARSRQLKLRVPETVMMTSAMMHRYGSPPDSAMSSARLQSARSGGIGGGGGSSGEESYRAATAAAAGAGYNSSGDEGYNNKFYNLRGSADNSSGGSGNEQQQQPPRTSSPPGVTADDIEAIAAAAGVLGTANVRVIAQARRSHFHAQARNNAENIAREMATLQNAASDLRELQMATVRSRATKIREEEESRNLPKVDRSLSMFFIRKVTQPDTRGAAKARMIDEQRERNLAQRETHARTMRRVEMEQIQKREQLIQKERRQKEDTQRVISNREAQREDDSRALRSSVLSSRGRLSSENEQFAFGQMFLSNLNVLDGRSSAAEWQRRCELEDAQRASHVIQLRQEEERRKLRTQAVRARTQEKKRQSAHHDKSERDTSLSRSRERHVIEAVQSRDRVVSSRMLRAMGRPHTTAGGMLNSIYDVPFDVSARHTISAAGFPGLGVVGGGGGGASRRGSSGGGGGGGGGGRVVHIVGGRGGGGDASTEEDEEMALGITRMDDTDGVLGDAFSNYSSGNWTKMHH